MSWSCNYGHLCREGPRTGDEERPGVSAPTASPLRYEMTLRVSYRQSGPLLRVRTIQHRRRALALPCWCMASRYRWSQACRGEN